MELDALDRVLFVLQTHYFIIFIFRPGGDFKRVGQSLPLDHQRVVADCGEGIGQPIKDALIGMSYHGRFAVHNLPGAGNDAPIAIADALVSQADAEDRHVGPEVLDNIVRDAGVLGGGGPGGDNYSLWFQLLDFLHSSLVIALNHHLLPQFTQVLEKVIGKAVVIIYQQYHVLTSHFPLVSKSLSSDAILCYFPKTIERNILHKVRINSGSISLELIANFSPIWKLLVFEL